MLAYLRGRPVIRSDRALLVPCSAEVAKVAVEQGAAGVAELVGVEVDRDWPPQDLREALPIHEAMVRVDSEAAVWGVWLILDAEASTLLGDVGFKGPPTEEGLIEVGYGIQPPFRRQGLATEAVRALLDWAETQPGVRGVLARCYVENVASQGVLRRLGFQLVGSDGRVLEWRLDVA